ncbi:N-acetyltransferase GCN5 [Secundilactobacillus odoratitofui DSM 19909 = JCM 15043]|uniref:N-acetyltransferase GCN5 n=1 Tax=Secundilactobacillus odoratitofui DSM 19909 = JCM 15043 TaxID=1423776 RepID=A0A0R1LNI8_9LACO|nr:GNAT family N-acetyltransferase [Secundilactobacillus odoratitofui]KRK97454.1 N-acetyltransferase GCN5 [Secundilactobacillus odoratitofui DSM 19909 = JCM 15043]
MEIRLMKPDDYEAAYALWSQTPGMNLKSLNNSYDGIKAIIDHNPTTCFVAEDAGQLVGTLLGGTDGRKGYFYHMAIAEAHRGQHIGSQLVQAVLKGFKDQNIVKIGLFTTNDNPDGRAFWEHVGFKVRPDITYLDLDL